MPPSPPPRPRVSLPDEAVLAAHLPVEPGATPAQSARRRRNQVCIGVIAVGLLNYLAYTLAYVALGGDAPNGHREQVRQPDGSAATAYFVRGHHIRSLEGLETRVSRGAWIYSYAHSISIPITGGAVLLALLVLARPHILATMRGGWVSGETFVTAFGTVVVLVAGGLTGLLTWHFISDLGGG